MVLLSDYRLETCHPGSVITPFDRRYHWWDMKVEEKTTERKHARGRDKVLVCYCLFLFVFFLPLFHHPSLFPSHLLSYGNAPLIYAGKIYC